MTTPDPAPFDPSGSRQDFEVDPRTLPPPTWSPSAPSLSAPPPYAPPQAALPVPAWARPRLPVLPAEPVEFQQLLRTPRHRWWKPLLTLAVFAAVAFFVINLVSLLLIPLGALRGSGQWAYYINQLTAVGTGDAADMGPVSFLFLNLSLIVLIPSAMFARWVVYRQHPRFLTSVTGGFRWRWLLRCLAVTVPIWAVYVGISTVLGGDPGPQPPQWGVLLVIALLTTPLQCAGEEYAFRGLILQTVGSWFRRPLVALIVAAVPAVGLFAAAHGSPDPFILAQLSVFALSCVIVTWRTGGLEGAIAMHACNNVLLMVVSLTVGGWGDQFVGGDTKGDLLGLVIEVVVDGVAVALILWQAKRAGLPRLSTPVVAPVTTGPAPAPVRA